jgi:hypothetical protein
MCTVSTMRPHARLARPRCGADRTLVSSVGAVRGAAAVAGDLAADAADVAAQGAAR